MSIETIKSAIRTKLDAMQHLKAAFSFPTANPSGYWPYAVVTLKGGEGEFATTAHNLEKHSFWIRVYQEQAKIGQGVEVAEDISVTVMDELRTAFNMDTTLSGNCKYCRPVSYDATYLNRELDVRVLEVQLDVWDVVSAA